MSRVINTAAVTLLVLLTAAAAHAAMRTDANGNIISAKSHIALTVKANDDVAGLAKVELWYRKQGGPWQKYPEDPTPGRNPGQFVITFNAPEDGIYEFYSVSIDKAGNSSGAPADATQPRIVVNFDTRPPELQVIFEREYKTLQPGSTVNFNWVAKDDNLKGVSVRYWWDGAADKPSSRALTGDSGACSIPVPGDGVSKLTMLLAAEDYAGHTATTQAFSFDVKADGNPATAHDNVSGETNANSSAITETPAAAGEMPNPPAAKAEPNDTAGGNAPPVNQDSTSERPAAQPTEPLNDGNAAKPEEPEIKPTALQVAIKYDVVQSGATGLDRVELWYTRVGEPDWKKKWTLYQFSTNGKGTFLFEAPDIAEYGFYIIAQNRAGQWSKPRPDGQTEIEPDYTKWVDPYAPFLKVISPRAGECLRGGSEVTIRWVANDDNLLEKPIKIELFSGDTSVLVVENATENDGVQTFQLPYKSGKYSIKVTATDRAGHVTEASTGEFFIDSGNIAVSMEVMDEEYMNDGMGVGGSETTDAANNDSSQPATERSYAAENSNNTASLTDEEARDAFTRGMSLKAKGGLQEAAELLKQAATHFSNDDVMVNEYGIALYEMKQYTGALEQFRRAAAIAPANGGYQWNIFLANYGLKDVDGTAQAAIDVLASDPNRAEARSMIDAVVKMYDENNRGSEVNAWLQKIIEGSHISDSLKTYVQSRMR